MKTRAAFQTQLATIMETLTKAAVTEINKLVEDGSVVLRLEVSRSHKEINRLMSKLQQVESELRTAQEAATRESRSVGVQVADQFEAAEGAVKQLMEQNCEAQACDSRPEFGYTVKEEQEEERVAQILHQTESEDSAGRLNNVGPEYVMFEIDNPLCSSFTKVDSNVTDNPVCAKATEQNSQSQSILSPKQHINTSMVVPGSTLSALGEDNHVLEGGVVKEEAGEQCFYSEETRAEMGDTQLTEHEQPPLSTDDHLTLEVYQPVQPQLYWQTGVTENSTDPVSSCNQNARIRRRAGKKEKHYSCAQCQKRIASFHCLERHQKVHTGEKPFNCAQCGKQLTSRFNLMTHEMAHTGNKPFGCAWCGKRFSLRCNLLRHERIHTGDKPFGCEHCGKRFAQEYHLRTHNRVHTGERPYHCTQCGKSFTQSSSLKTHQKMHSRDKILEFGINSK